MGWVFLSGMMGSGKSTVGRALAAMRSARFVDLDARVVEAAGRDIAALFGEEGEAAFRARERRALEAVLTEPPCVVALGGGTVLDRSARWELLERGALITLEASTGELARRVGTGDERPLLGGDPEASLRRIRAARAGAYAECHGAVATEGLSPEEVARRVDALAGRDAMVVPLGERTYRVEVEHGLREGWADDLGEVTRWLFVTDENVASPWAARARAAVGGAASEVVLPPGEAHKRLPAVDRVWDAALEDELDRDSVIVGVGGGVVGDLAGFAAATLLRGVRFVQMPTSLLAMVDASVGGKTGFDRAQGKNLVGAFHQPRAVHVDLESLTTLPAEELRSGAAEVLKAAWLDGEDAVAELERDAAAILALEPDAVRRAVRRAIRHKIRVVARDEREGGLRRTLNLGHTLGHALEAASGYVGLKHGEAVGLGMLAAFDVARALGDADAPAHRARVAALLDALELPHDLSAHLSGEALGYLRADKKRVGDAVRFVVPGGPGAVGVERVPLETLDRLFGSP